MTGAIKTICEQAFEMFDIARIEGRVFANNPGARRALEKAGFTLEGVLRKSVYKNGYLFDCLLLARLKDGE